MNNEQYAKITAAEDWLIRTWNDDTELEQLKAKRDKIVGSLSGIGKYDDNSVPGGCDSNPTESKNIEYSLLSQKIEEIQERLSVENARTINAIYSIPDKKDGSKIRGMLIARYINRLSWKRIGEIYHYQERHSYNYRTRCLMAIFPYIPKDEVIINDNQSYYSV